METTLLLAIIKDRIILSDNNRIEATGRGRGRERGRGKRERERECKGTSSNEVKEQSADEG